MHQVLRAPLILTWREIINFSLGIVETPRLNGTFLFRWSMTEYPT